jgi:hypothetical protein
MEPKSLLSRSKDHAARLCVTFLDSFLFVLPKYQLKDCPLSAACACHFNIFVFCGRALSCIYGTHLTAILVQQSISGGDVARITLPTGPQREKSAVLKTYRNPIHMIVIILPTNAQLLFIIIYIYIYLAYVFRPYPVIIRALRYTKGFKMCLKYLQYIRTF